MKSWFSTLGVYLLSLTLLLVVGLFAWAKPEAVQQGLHFTGQITPADSNSVPQWLVELGRRLEAFFGTGDWQRLIAEGDLRRLFSQHEFGPWALVGGVLALLTAIANRKRIVEHRYSSGDGDAEDTNRSGIGTRLKRLLISLILGAGIFFTMRAVLDGTIQTVPLDLQTRDIILYSSLGVVFLCLITAVYQFLAALVLLFLKIWR